MQPNAALQPATAAAYYTSDMTSHCDSVAAAHLLHPWRPHLGCLLSTLNSVVALALYDISTALRCLRVPSPPIPRIVVWRPDFSSSVRELLGHEHVIESVTFATEAMLRHLHAHKKAPLPLPSSMLVRSGLQQGALD